MKTRFRKEISTNHIIECLNHEKYSYYTIERIIANKDKYFDFKQLKKLGLIKIILNNEEIAYFELNIFNQLFELIGKPNHKLTGIFK